MADQQGYDVAGARKAGLSDDDILGYLNQDKSYDVDGARKSGLSNDDMIGYLASRPAPAAKVAMAGASPATPATKPVPITGPVPPGLIGPVATPEQAFEAQKNYVPGIPKMSALPNDLDELPRSLATIRARAEGPVDRRVPPGPTGPPTTPEQVVATQKQLSPSIPKMSALPTSTMDDVDEFQRRMNEPTGNRVLDAIRTGDYRKLVPPAPPAKPATITPESTDQDIENAASESFFHHSDQIGRGAARALGAFVSPESLDSMAMIAMTGRGLAALANTPKLARALRNAPEVLKALDVAAGAAVPAAVAGYGGAQLLTQPAPSNLEEATETAINALILGAGTIGAIEAGKSVLSRYAAETSGNVRMPGGAEVPAKSVGGIPEVDPRQAAANAAALESQGQNLAAMYWNGRNLNAPTEFSTTAGRMFLQPAQIIKKAGGKVYRYESVLDADGNLVVGGTPETVRQWLEHRKAKVNTYAAVPGAGGAPLIADVGTVQTGASNLKAAPGTFQTADTALESDAPTPPVTQQPLTPVQQAAGNLMQDTLGFNPMAPGTESAAPQLIPDIKAFQKARAAWLKQTSAARDEWELESDKRAVAFMEANPGVTWEDAKAATADHAPAPQPGQEPRPEDFKTLAPPPKVEPVKEVKPDKTKIVTGRTNNPPTAATATTPESPETIAAQVTQLGEGTRRVVMFPRGQGQPAQFPDNVGITSDGLGNTYAYNKDLITPAAVQTAARNNTLPEILGHAQMGMGAPDKSMLQGDVVVVVVRDANGVEVQSTATDEAHLEQTTAASQALMPEGGSVGIETPEQAVGGRTEAPAALQAPGRVGGGAEAGGAPVQPPEQEVASEYDGVPLSVLSAFPGMISPGLDLIPLSNFSQTEQAALRSAGLVETGTSKSGEYEGVDSGKLWPLRSAASDAGAGKTSTHMPAPPTQFLPPRQVGGETPTGDDALIGGRTDIQAPAPFKFPLLAPFSQTFKNPIVSVGSIRDIYPESTFSQSDYVASATPTLDDDDLETGWLSIPAINGGVLIDPQSGKALSFIGDGTPEATGRAKSEAQTWAIENRIKQPIKSATASIQAPGKVGGVPDAVVARDAKRLADATQAIEQAAASGQKITGQQIQRQFQLGYGAAESLLKSFGLDYLGNPIAEQQPPAQELTPAGAKILDTIQSPEPDGLTARIAEWTSRDGSKKGFSVAFQDPESGEFLPDIRTAETLEQARQIARKALGIPEPDIPEHMENSWQALQDAMRSVVVGGERQNHPDPVAIDVLRALSKTPGGLRAFDSLVASRTEQQPTFLGAGVGHAVLDLGNGEVLKLGKLQKQERSRYALQPEVSGEIGSVAYAIYPKLDTSGISDADVDLVDAQLRSEGLEWSDAGKDNLGRDANGDLKILDGDVTRKPSVPAPRPVGGEASITAAGEFAKKEMAEQERLESLNTGKWAGMSGAQIADAAKELGISTDAFAEATTRRQQIAERGRLIEAIQAKEAAKSQTILPAPRPVGGEAPAPEEKAPTISKDRAQAIIARVSAVMDEAVKAGVIGQENVSDAIAMVLRDIPDDATDAEMDQVIALLRSEALAPIDRVEMKHPLTYFTGSSGPGVEKRANERGDIGLLITPLIDYLGKVQHYPVIAVDNGAFSKATPFSADKFLALLDKVAADPEVARKVQFVVAPDTPMDAKATLEKFPMWAAEIQKRGLPVALAGQNGLEDMIDQIPWDDFDTLFMGGDDEWKLGDFKDEAQKKKWLDLLWEAGQRGKKIHVGRVNSFKRSDFSNYQMEAISVDGTYLAHGPDKNLPKLESWLNRINERPYSMGPRFPNPRPDEAEDSDWSGDPLEFAPYRGSDAMWESRNGKFLIFDQGDNSPLGKFSLVDTETDGTTYHKSYAAAVKAAREEAPPIAPGQAPAPEPANGEVVSWDEAETLLATADAFGGTITRISDTLIHAEANGRRLAFEKLPDGKVRVGPIRAEAPAAAPAPTAPTPAQPNYAPEGITKAEKYVGRLAYQAKKDYARAYLDHLTLDEAAPARGKLSEALEKEVKNEINKHLGKRLAKAPAAKAPAAPAVRELADFLKPGAPPIDWWKTDGIKADWETVRKAYAARAQRPEGAGQTFLDYTRDWEDNRAEAGFDRRTAEAATQVEAPTTQVAALTDLDRSLLEYLGKTKTSEDLLYFEGAGEGEQGLKDMNKALASLANRGLVAREYSQTGGDTKFWRTPEGTKALREKKPVTPQIQTGVAGATPLGVKPEQMEATQADILLRTATRKIDELIEQAETALRNQGENNARAVLDQLSAFLPAARERVAKLASSADGGYVDRLESAIARAEAVIGRYAKKPAARAAQPSAERFDELSKELAEIERSPQYRQDTEAGRNARESANSLSVDVAFHRPAAIARAQAEIDAEKAAKSSKAWKYELKAEGKWSQPLGSPLATEAEAKAAGQSHLDRWMMAEDVRTAEVNEKPTHTWNEAERRQEPIQKEAANAEGNTTSGAATKSDAGSKTGPRRPGEADTASLAEVSAEDSSEAQGEGAPERDGERGGRGARPDGQPNAGGGVRSGSGGRSGSGTVDQSGDTDGGRRGPGDLERQTEGGDFRISDADHIGEGSPRQKLNGNLDAIRIVKAIEKDPRPATPEEQEKLAKYVGWGSLANVFDWRKSEFEGAREELKKLLTPDEYRAAEKSTYNAHYTSPLVISSMWDAMKRLGVKPGFSVIEPSMGVGNFFGLQPDGLMPSRRTGVELDKITGAIAKLLYPDSNVQVTGFERIQLPHNFFDVAIGNVPFGNVGVVDPSYRKTPAATSAIHNYFFVKSLDLTRPGGIVAFITSRYTMDSLGKEVRDMIADRANLIGMFRLPNTAFKGNAGTSVVTDVIFLQKRAPGEARTGPSFIETKKVATADGTETDLNEYYAARPEMMLGELSTQGTQYAADSQTLIGKLTPELLQNAVNQLPENIFSEWHADTPSFDGEFYQLGDEVKDGGYAIKDGVIVQREGNIYRPTVVGKTQGERIRGMIPVRAALRKVFATQLEAESSEKAILDARKELNKAYDKFVKEHGYLSSVANSRALGDDPDYSPLAGALEDWDRDTKTAAKTDIFTKRTIERPSFPDKADTAAEAMAMVLNEKGRLDWNRMQELTGKSLDELRAELTGQVFKNPDGQIWETEDEYLSGNVRKKLRIAEAAAGIDPFYQRNVDALLAIQPADLLPEQIKIVPGAHWIPATTIQEFLREVLGLDSAKVHHAAAVATWSINVPNSYELDRTQNKSFGTENFTGVKLFDMSLNGKAPRVYRPGPGDTRIFDPKATAVALAAQDALNDRFREWIWHNPSRARELAEIYNREINNIRNVEHNGAHLTLPGSNPAIVLRPHQKNAIWRALKTGNTLLAHEVGAGKAQPLDAKILTPSGWKLMGDMTVGDHVIAGDGSVTSVEAVFPQGEKDIFRVEFSDGSATECCDEHLWLTQTYQERNQAQRAEKAEKDWNCGKAEVRSLAEIRNTLIAPHLNAKNHSIPIVGAVHFNAQPVPLHPYLLGTLIGDGCFRGHGSVSISSADKELLDAISLLLPAECELRHQSAYDYVIAWNGQARYAVGDGMVPSHPVVNAVKSLGLWGKYSYEKHIPECYLFNSQEVRASLLQGLMDTDGTVTRRGTSVEYCTTSPKLAAQVTDLVRSLGGIVALRSKQPGYTHQGVRKIGRVAFTLTLSLPPSVLPFRLSRKAILVTPKTKYHPARYITNVAPVGRKQAQCIRVAHRSHLYVTDDYIVTHNTWEMVGIAMESRRLGLSKKPMLVVPNHMAEQFTNEFLQLYPAARILTIGKEDFAADKRKRATARISGGNWDAVIIRHSSFEKIPVSDATFKAFIDRQVEELKAALEAQEAETASAQTTGRRGRGGKKKVDKSVKEIQKAIERLAVKLEKRLNRDKKDDAVTFEELGVDLLLVDEAHAFKALPIVTRRTRVAGIPNRESNRATDMFMKTQYVGDLNGGRRGVVFATGTPVTNTMAELYNMQRYLQLKTLREAGIEHFDAWANAFGMIRTGVELDVSGKGFRENTRFARFVNIPELMAIYKRVADIKTAAMLNLPTPELFTGNVEPISVKETPELTAYVDYLIDRTDVIRGGGVDPKDDNMLKVVSEGKKAALDMRLVDPEAQDRPESKVNTAVGNIYKIWEETSDDKLTQLVFCDLSVPLSAKSRKAKKQKPTDEEQQAEDELDAVPEAAGEAAGFSVYDDMKAKLVARGIPAKEIAFIHDYDSDDAKQDLFDSVKAGRVRVLFGSTEKMGVGTNVQRRMIALHHMDSPWRPADITQREGRIKRQGNKNPKIHIFQYLTEGSFDAFMWQTLETKAMFIAPILSGDSSIREMEDIGMVLPSAAEFKAMASGNPIIKEKIGTDSELARLDAQRNAFRRQQAGVREQIEKLPRDIAWKQRDIARRQSQYDFVEAHQAEGYTIEGVAFTGADARKNAAAALHAELSGTLRLGGSPSKVGTYKGLDIVAWPGSGSYPRLTVNMPGSAYDSQFGEIGISFPVSTNEDNPLGTLQSIEAGVRIYITSPEKQSLELEELLRKQKDLEDQGEKPWPYENRYNTLVKRKIEIDAELDQSEAERVGGAEDGEDTVKRVERRGVSYQERKKLLLARERGENVEYPPLQARHEVGSAPMPSAPAIRTTKNSGPMSAYTPGDGELAPRLNADRTPVLPTWYRQEIDGKNFYSDGVFVIQGDTPEGKIVNNDGLKSYVKPQDGQVEMGPLAYSIDKPRDDGSVLRRVWLSPRLAVDSIPFDYVKKRFPDATFWATDNPTKPVTVRSGDDVVAVIMPLRETAPPANIEPALSAKPRTSSVTLGMGPGQEMYEATAKYIKEETLPWVKRILSEKATMGRALVEILDPRYNTPRPIMDTVSKMAGGRSMAEYLVAKKLDNWSQKFSKMSRQDSINFVDRVKAGLPQPDDDLQDAADFMRRMDDQVWSSIPEDRRPAYLENHFRVMWKVIPDSNKAIAAREARAQELVDGMTDPTRQAYAQDYLAYITEQTPDEPEIPEGVQPAVARKIRLRIDKILQSKAGGTGYVGASRKNLRGTRSFLNQHTLESMSEGMEHGGEPVSYNPLLMFAAHYNDAMKYVTALRMIEKFKADGTARFLKSGKPMFDGYAKLDDNAARVALKTPQGFVATGEWVFQRNAANLLNNMLGRDYLREVYEDAPMSRFTGRAGRSLLNIKNAYTAIELGWSPYHAVFEGIEAVGSMMGIGLRESYNTGIVPLVSFALGIPTDVGVTSAKTAFKNIAKGVGTLATSPWAFVSAAQEGAQARRGWTEEVIGAVDNVKPKLFDKLLPEVAVDYLMARRAERAMKKTVAGRQFVKNNPAAAQAIPYYFIGGGKLGLPEEFETHGAEELQRHWNDMLDKQRTGNQRVSSGLRAGLKALPASSQYMLKPLFQNYIPNLKLAFFLREFGLAQVERAGELERGEITLDQIARLVVGSVENRFGEMNFDRLFWDRTMKTFLQILFRSVTWKIGELSELGRAVYGQGKGLQRDIGKGRIPRLDPSMGWLVGVALAAALVGTVLTMATTGHPPKDMQGLLYPVIDDSTGLTVALASYIRNYFHMKHDPVGYVKSSFQGEVGKVMDVINNQDFRHQKIWQDDDPMYQQAMDAMLHLLPEPITSGGIKKIRQGDTKEGIASMLAFSKAPAYIDKTPAELLAQDIAGQHRSVGGRSKAAADKAEAASRIRRAYKAGNTKGAEDLIAKQVAAGVISKSDGNTYRNQAGRSPLDAMVKQFSVSEALRVYDKAEADEKKTLGPIVKAKVWRAKNYHPAEFGDPGSNTWNLATKHFGVKPPPAARQGQVTQ